MSVVRHIAWLAFAVQFTLLIGTVLLVRYLGGPPSASMLVLVAYFLYVVGSRSIIPRDQRRGEKLLRDEQYEEAIEAFQASYDFFTRHAWLDRFRAITVLSISAVSYREMALCNIAYCYSKMGKQDRARKFFQQTLEEFPGNDLAKSGLRALDVMQQESAPSGDEESAQDETAAK